ncbi:TPA: hypothetical protein GDO54_018545, partial [Pyxicephalus adspersus]
EPSLPPLSEYAPPINTSSDHLIACNPFDDCFSLPNFSEYKFLDYSLENALRMPPNTPQKRPYNVDNRMFRDQPRPLIKDQMVMVNQPPPLIKDRKVTEKSFPLNIGVPEKSSFENAFFYSGLGQTITMPGQHFRTKQNEEDLNRMIRLHSSTNDFQADFYRPQAVKLNASEMDISDSFAVEQKNILPSKIFRSVQNRVLALDDDLRNEGLQSRLLQNMRSGPTQIPKNGKRTAKAGKPQHVPDPVDLFHHGRTNGTRNRRALSRLAKSDVTPSEKCNKWLLHSDFYGNLSADVVYRCGMCFVEVNITADAIKCEASCRKWFHRTCTGLTEVAHTLLKAEASAVWCCDRCMASKDVQLVQLETKNKK